MIRAVGSVLQLRARWPVGEMRQLATAAGGRALPKRFDGFMDPTVWVEFSPLAAAAGAENLGQGFPNWPPPDFVKDAVQEVLTRPEPLYHQYTLPSGSPLFCQKLAEFYSPLLGRELDPVKEIVPTVGATQALYLAMQGLVDKGDNVVLIEPSYDSYAAVVQMAGGTVRWVPLRGNATTGATSTRDYFKLDMDMFRDAFDERTRAVLLNTPHNPTGKMFSRDELEEMASIIRAHAPEHCVVVTDEVYEFITFDDEEHVRFATLPDMDTRTITISSSGKTFSCTGWKLGWAIGAPHLMQAMTIGQQWITFCVPSLQQTAIALALDGAQKPFEGHPTYFDWLRAEYTRKRGILLDAIGQTPITPVVPQGTFFIMGDTSEIASFPTDSLHTIADMPTVMQDPRTLGRRDYDFARYLTLDVGVTPIPPSAFYGDNIDLARNMARFAFCKEDKSLYEAARRLQKLA